MKLRWIIMLGLRGCWCEAVSHLQCFDYSFYQGCFSLKLVWRSGRWLAADLPQGWTMSPVGFVSTQQVEMLLRFCCILHGFISNSSSLCINDPACGLYFADKNIALDDRKLTQYSSFLSALSYFF